MNIFETVKAAVEVKQAAQRYGLEVNRSGMTCCLFHQDQHPSMKINQDYFFCFGCGASGDVIKLTAKLFGLTAYAAAQKLAADFGIDPHHPPAAAAMQKPPHSMMKTFRENELRCHVVLCTYLRWLEDWKKRYAPKNEAQVFDDRYVEACQMLEYVTYLADVLAVGDLELRIKTVELLQKDGTITALAERLERLQKEVTHHALER